jgi:lipoate-protein ligase A
MLRLNLTLENPAANISLDEALLEHAETSAEHPQLLRLWQPQTPMVVIGRSSPLAAETNQVFCAQNQIPIVRRCSGGQSIVTGPGCLMYAVLLDYRLQPELRMLDVAHHFVMTKMRSALKSIGVDTDINGTSDLTIDGRKVSGNSLRCKRNWMIYHGTMICDLDIDLIASCLGQPIRQPDYRSQRNHRDFLVQIKVPVEQLADAIAVEWSASPGAFDWPEERNRQLLTDKYLTDEWNHKVP